MLAGLDGSIADDVHHPANLLRHHLTLNPRPDTRRRYAVVVRLPPERMGGYADVDGSRADHVTYPLSESPHIDTVLAAIRAKLLAILASERADRPFAI